MKYEVIKLFVWSRLRPWEWEWDLGTESWILWRDYISQHAQGPTIWDEDVVCFHKHNPNCYLLSGVWYQTSTKQILQQVLESSPFKHSAKKLNCITYRSQSVPVCTVSEGSPPSARQNPLLNHYDPQESIFFIIYSPTYHSRISIHLYADDTQIYFPQLISDQSKSIWLALTTYLVPFQTTHKLSDKNCSVLFDAFWNSYPILFLS